MLLQVKFKFNKKAKDSMYCSLHPLLCGYKTKLSLAGLMTLHSNAQSMKENSLAPANCTHESPKSTRDFREIRFFWCVCVKEQLLDMEIFVT